jgi:GDP-mannose transporter
MIFTSAKALQYISIPTYTIFKNLTIILIAYGEVLWFGGSVTGLALLSFGLMVLSSVVSAWADISAAIGNYSSAPHEAATELASLNAGYIWMLLNCLSSATFVLSMRKRIKVTQFSDFDSISSSNNPNDSHVLQQSH